MTDPQPTEPFTYRCCFCKQERISYWTPNPMFTLEKWQSKLACNKCADYHHSRIDLCEKIARVCRALMLARQFNNKEIQAITTACDSKLVELTRKLAKAACDYLKLETVWDREFVVLLVAKPEQQHKAIGAYLSGLKGLI